MEVGLARTLTIFGVILIYVVPVVLVFGGIVYVATRFANRKNNAVTVAGTERLLRQEAETADLRAQLAEVHERLDFMERTLLAQIDSAPAAPLEPRHLTPV
jgi:hypothetical protein